MVSGKRIKLDYILHMGIWLLVYALPFMIFRKNNEPDVADKMLHQAVIVLSLLIAFYSNYFILIEKYLFHKKIGKFLLINAVIIILLGIGVHIWNELTLPKHLMHPDFENRSMKTFTFIFRDIVSLIFVAGISVALKTTGKWYRIEAEHQEEAKKRTEAELLTLRQQINPHFLFNTLNNIYSLIQISPEKAQDVVLDLSKLMRYVLYENSGDRVELNKEIEFVHKYVELMRIRLTDSVEITFTDKVDKVNNWLITPMLYVTLVENAFKHGVSPTEKSFIHIVFELDGNHLKCSVQNSFFPKSNADLAGSGIGLENLKRRLEILYPENHEFYAGELNGIYYTKIVVPLLESNT